MSSAKRLGAAALAIVCMLFAAVAFSQSASAYPTGTEPQIALDHSSGPVGDKVVVTGQDFTPNKTATLTFHSASIALGTVNVSSSGTFSVTITVPSDPIGEHVVIGRDVASGQDSNAANYTITAGGTGGTGGGGGGLANTGVAVLGIAALGLVLLVGGGLMLMAGRRRKVVA
jgi:hypothetical protein